MSVIFFQESKLPLAQVPRVVFPLLNSHQLSNSNSNDSNSSRSGCGSSFEMWPRMWRRRLEPCSDDSRHGYFELLRFDWLRQVIGGTERRASEAMQNLLARVKTLHIVAAFHEQIGVSERSNRHPPPRLVSVFSTINMS